MFVEGEQEGLRERLGGKWSISWQTWTISTVIVCLGLAASVPSATLSAALFFTWMLIGFLGSLFVGLWLLMLHLTLFRNRSLSPVPIWIVIATSFMSGLILTFAVTELSRQVGLEADIGKPDQYVVIGVVAVWFGCMMILLFDYRDRTSRARNFLISQAVQLEVEDLQRQGLSAILRDQINHQVDSELHEARMVLAQRISAQNAETQSEAKRDDWIAASVVLKGTAQDLVRPISKRLWRDMAEKYPSRSWWVLIPNTIADQPFRPGLILFIHLVGTGVATISLFGRNHGTLLLASSVLAVLAITLPANALMRRFPNQHSIIFLMALLVLQAGVPVTARVREFWVPGSAPLAWQVAQITLGICVVILTSAVGAWRNFDAQARDIFRERLLKKRVISFAENRHVAELTREASRTLHGSVQTRLYSCSMALDRAALLGDEVMASQALQEAMEVLAAPLREPVVLNRVADEVERKVSLWGSLCVFDVQVSVHADHDTIVNARNVGRLVEEAISNAVRHGRASRIDIRVGELSNTEMSISVTDDGVGPTPGGHAGIGSALFDQMCSGDWSLTATAEGTQLNAGLKVKETTTHI